MNVARIDVESSEVRSKDGKTVMNSHLKMEFESLRQQLQESFPADSVSADLAQPEEVIRLAKDLLERLWRREN